MKITFDWLKDHLKTNLKEKNLLEQLTNIGLEVESVENLSAEMHMDPKISRVCLLVCLLSSQGDVQVFIFSSSSFFLACSSSFPIIICYHLLQYFTGFSLICCAFSTGAEACSHAL